jgi:hypothetical protein
LMESTTPWEVHPAEATVKKGSLVHPNFMGACLRLGLPTADHTPPLRKTLFWSIPDTM